ncbi:MAG TPA: hypothetical protein VHX15_20630 [Frankiaceae bacterium]|jgi:hypothetical protein|nr:hypothetical protein [Frankiaceae bacterium]
MNVLDLLLPATAHIACQNERHRLRWERGEIRALDHDDIPGELTLAALGGEPIRCAELVTAWQHAQEDLRVLVLASRGGADPLNPPATEDPTVSAGSAMPQAGPGWAGYSSSVAVTRSGRSNLRRAAAVPAAMPGLAIPGRQFLASSPGTPGHELPREDPLLELMRLPGGLPDRLVAMVISHWVERIDAGTAPASVSAALSVALAGRVSHAVQMWLGSTGIEVDVQLLSPDTPCYLERIESHPGEAIRCGLPFAWLSDVWLTGLTHLLGRFSLDARYIDDAVILDTADTALNLRTLTLSGGIRPR